MTKATSTTKADARPKTANVLAVDAKLIESNKLDGSMKALVLEAAQLAIKELTPKTRKLSAKDQSLAITKNHTETLAGVSDNVRNIFKAALMLLIAPNTVIEFTPARGKTGAVTMKAGEAVKAGIAKHALMSAAKVIRENEGTGNASGGGRKASAPKTDNVKVSFLAALPAMMKDLSAVAEIRAALKTLGYDLKPIISKVKKPSGIASTAAQILAANNAKPAPAQQANA